MSEGPQGYDREFTTPMDHRIRRRIGYSHESGTITRFVVQLEYDLGNWWAQVVRFDHDPDSQHSHNVARDGVHMDVYRDGEKLRSEEVFPPMDPPEALTYAEDHLNQHAQRYIERFEQWHGIERR